jgi:hypothetical protein
MIDKNNKYCPRIHHGLTLSSINNDNLSFSVCCWGTSFTNTAIDFYTKKFIELRNINQKNELPMPFCHRCSEQENSNKKSMRLGYAETHGPETYESSLQYLDINIDNTCNLACVTCTPELSTTWRKELKIKNMSVRPNISNFINTHLDSLDITQLKEIRLWGGEPFLTNTHKDILQYVVETGNAHNIKLMYNTNGTRLIDDETKKLIEKFKFARISFSIDGIGKKFNYIRYPADWDQVEKNLLWWKNNLPHNSMLSSTITASILNVLDLDEIFEWHKLNFSHSVFGDPIEIYVHQAFGDYGLEFMPTAMIDYLKALPNYSQPWIQNLGVLGQHQLKLDNTLKLLREIDTRRNLNFGHVAPLAAKLLGYQK